MTTDNSLAELIVVGLLSGAGGALLTTLLRIGHEREEQLRARLIEASDDLVTGVIQATIPLRIYLTANMRDATEAQAAAATLHEVRRLADEAMARLARVQLLFGPTSPAGDAAGLMVRSLQDALLEAEKPNADRAVVREHGSAAADHMGAFNELVHRRVAIPRWRHTLFGLRDWSATALGWLWRRQAKPPAGDQAESQQPGVGQDDGETS